LTEIATFNRLAFNLQTLGIEMFQQNQTCRKILQIVDKKW